MGPAAWPVDKTKILRTTNTFCASAIMGMNTPKPVHAIIKKI